MYAACRLVFALKGSRVRPTVLYDWTRHELFVSSGEAETPFPVVQNSVVDNSECLQERCGFPVFPCCCGRRNSAPRALG